MSRSRDLTRPFIPGLDLAEAFYREAVKPILDAAYPDLPYTAAHVGTGSDVLGYDTPQSMDHHWGPQLHLFLLDDREEDLAARISATLSERLPTEVRGFSTNFGPPDEFGVRLRQPVESGPVEHMVQITTINRFLQATLGINASVPLTNRDWLIFPQQRLLEVTAGRVFHDDLGFGAVRSRFAWYPHAVWQYLLAGQWKRIAQEEPFVGRTGDVGDDLGSALLAGRLVHDIMRLVFLMERRYAPYSKWFGTAFSRLPSATTLQPVLQAVLEARAWEDRERHLSQAYGIAAQMHHDLGLTRPLPTEVSGFHDRPFQVIHAERFADALRGGIDDPWLRSLPDLGGIDQITDNTDVLSYPRVFQALSSVYEPHQSV